MAGLFSEILNKTTEDVKRPPNAPVGTYVLAVQKVPEIGEVKSEKGEWDTITYQLRGVRATDDVDPDELKAYGDPKNIFVRKQFMFDRKDEAAFARTEFSHKEFLEKHLGMGSGNLKELMSQTAGKQCLGAIAPRQDTRDSNVWYDDLKRTAPLE